MVRLTIFWPKPHKVNFRRRGRKVYPMPPLNAGLCVFLCILPGIRITWITLHANRHQKLPWCHIHHQEVIFAVALHHFIIRSIEVMQDFPLLKLMFFLFIMEHTALHSTVYIKVIFLQCPHALLAAFFPVKLELLIVIVTSAEKTLQFITAAAELRIKAFVCGNIMLRPAFSWCW